MIVMLYFTNGETARITEGMEPQTVFGEVVPVADVLGRLAAGEVLFVHGEATRAPADAPDWLEAEAEVIGPSRTLLHLAGLAYASEIREG